MKDFKPDVVWHGNTVMSVAATVRDAYSLQSGADHIVNLWGFDENLPKLAGKAAEGVMGAAVCAFYGEDTPMMANVLEYGKKYNPGMPAEKRTIRHDPGLVQRPGPVGSHETGRQGRKLDGEGILKDGFETMQELRSRPGWRSADIHRHDHRVSGQVPIYTINNGKIILVKASISKSRWPDNWANEWLGW